MKELNQYKNLSEKSEKYELRKARSLQMLNEGLEPVSDGINEYWIPSQTDKNKRYKVTIKNGWYSCECPDNKEGNLCKHILLLKTFLAIKLKSQQRVTEINEVCPYCNSNNIIRDGTRKTTLGKKQKWLCQTCNGRFVLEPIKKCKGNAEVITLAMDLFFKGCSYRDIQDTLKQSFGLKIHHETVRRWINTYMAKITEYTDTLQPQVSNVWHADEQKVKLKQKEGWAWDWNVMDSETRFLLANQITKERYIKDARRVFRQAKAKANKTAEKVVTDGLQAYRKAIRKEFMTYQNPKPHIRMRTIRDEIHNNKIERYHNTFRERDKVMRGFQNKETAEQYNKQFKTYYNFIRPHQALNGLTPAQASGIEEPREIKKLLLKSLSAETRQPLSDSQ